VTRRRTLTLTTMALIGLVVAALPQVGFAQSDSFLGTWQLNLAKSKFNPGPPPKSNTVNIQAVIGNSTYSNVAPPTAPGPGSGPLAGNPTLQLSQNKPTPPAPATALLPWPLVARAQQRAMPVIGFLDGGSIGRSSGFMVAFRQGLAEAGYGEGQNVATEYRSANGQFFRLPALAAELVDRQVAVIVAVGARGPVLAAKAATSSIPIVFAYGGDPVENGVVASLNRPGGNVTGVTRITAELGGKRLDILHELVPEAKTFAFLSHDSSDIGYEGQKSQILAAGRALGLQVIILETRSDRDYEESFKTLVQGQAGGLVVGPFPFRNTNKIVAQAAHYKVPTIYPDRGYVVAGGLMSYGGADTDFFRQAGKQTGRILNGDKPADLPVQRSSRFTLAINLTTAKVLGLTVPRILRAGADEVIE
jgi:putative tryptophan/tyrosine transport system substrate-binding protein